MQNTINTLKELRGIEDKVVVEYPYTTISSNQLVIGRIDTKELDDEFETFGINNLRQFLSLVDSIGGEIKQDGNVIRIEGKVKQTYEVTNPEFLENYTFDVGIFDKVLTIDPETEITLDLETLKTIKKMASILGHTQVVFDRGNNKIIITTMNDDGSLQNPTEIDLEMEGNTKIVIEIDHLNKLPEQDYNVKFVRNPSSGIVVSYWKNEDKPYEFLVATDEVDGES